MHNRFLFELEKLKLDMLAIEVKLLMYRCSFNPDQPRVPAGSPDGGQWAGEGGSVSGDSNGIHATPISYLKPAGSSASHVTEQSHSKLTIHNHDGSNETRSGGSRSWRNNNSGNLRAGTFANSHGAIGSAGGFAVFPDEATGDVASEALLKTPIYSKLTIDEAIARRSPSSENDTSNLQNTIRKIAGFTGSEVIGDLSDDEISRFAAAIKRTEGWIPGTVVN
jgi:hypothetical protein